MIRDSFSQFANCACRAMQLFYCEAHIFLDALSFRLGF